MIFGNDRNELRNMYRDAWKKRCAKAPLTPLEAQSAAVIEWHPEYHDEITQSDLETDYTPDGGTTNPYLHMGLHLGVREQVATHRPAGIRHVYETLASKTGDPHDAEHQMIECLAETLWEAKSQNRPPDEQKYLERLHRLIR